MRWFATSSLALGLLFPAGLPVSAATQLPPPAPAASTGRFTDAEKADLKRVADYLNTLKNVQGRFLQIDGSGRSQQGNFYLRKPGRVRFEYQKPNPNLIIADGTTVAVENSDLKTTDRYPLLNSPLRLLLNNTSDLAADPRIAVVKKEEGLLSVTARETSGAAQGSITLNFTDAGNSLELRQWDVVDAQGQRTTVVVSEMRMVADLPARLFIIEDLSPFKKSDR
jgi:outer membrane lipoprotein-sorting protein